MSENIVVVRSDLVTMRLGETLREVHFVPPHERMSSHYMLDVDAAGGMFHLDRDKLVSTIEELTSLVGSGVRYDNSHGFNDPAIMGDIDAQRAKDEGLSYIWISAVGSRVGLEILPRIHETLKGEEEYDLEEKLHPYAYDILSKTVAFVEDPSSYTR